MQIDITMKILVADDMPSMRNTIKGVLKQLGYTDMVEADDGLQALAQLKKGKFGLLITDWNMPHMDGVTLLRMIRNDETLKDLPVLMVTAEAERDHVLEAMKAGINDYILKPFTADTMQKKIETVILKKDASGVQK